MAVIVYDSTQAGAPTLNGVAGSMISVLDACLVNGYGLVTLDSLTQTGGVATATRGAGIGFKKGDTIQIAGASPAGWNGIWRVTAATATTATFTVDSGLTSPATGTITAKIPALGWTKSFSTTNKAAYKSSDVAGTGAFLRVDETVAAANYARVAMYETMSDINTGSGISPASSFCSWPKSDVLSAAARPWRIVGDERGFYLFTDPSNYQDGRSFSFFFGDIVPLSSPDPYAACLTGATADNAGGYESNYTTLKNVDGTSTAEIGRFSMRRFNGTGASSAFRLHGHGLSSQVDNGPVAFPNAAGNGLLVAPVFVTEAANATFRGRMPGFYASYHSNAVSHLDRVISTINSTPRELLGVQAGSSISNPRGICLLDVSGPWR